jgi:hypothetical protein
MHLLRLAAIILAITGGYLALSGGSVSATPLGAGALAAHTAESPLLHKAQYRRHYRHHRAYRHYRPWRPVYRPIYRPRPRVVCRIRYGRRGPRQVCVRRW